MRELCGQLASEGFDAWLDEQNLLPGHDWDLEIRKALRLSDVIIICLSRSSVAKEGYVQKEIKQALEVADEKPDGTIFVIPLKLEACDVPGRLSRWQWVDYFERNGFRRLLQALRVRAESIGGLGPLLPKSSSRGTERTKEDQLANQRQRIYEGIAHQQQSQHDAAERYREVPNGQRVVGERPSQVVEHFKDRDRQRQELMRLLADRATRMVSIIGRGGNGKTALASKVLADIGGYTSGQNEEQMAFDGIVYLSTRTDGITLERIFRDAARLLGGDRGAGLIRVWTNSFLSLTERISRLLNELSDGRYILFFDNMDQLLNDDGKILDPGVNAFVEATLTSQGSVRLLITSRGQIRLPVHLTRFNLVVALNEGLPIADGVAILRELDPNNDYLLREAPHEKLAEVVTRAYGLPRALEVLVGLLDDNKFLTVDELLPRFYDQASVVESLVGAAYHGLELTEQRVVQAVAVYGRPVPAVAVDFMLEQFHPGLDILVVLRRLERLQMIGVDRATKLCYLHPIDREVAYRALPQDGEYCRTSLERRAAGYYRRLRKPGDQWRTIDDLEPQLKEFEHLLSAGDNEVAAAVLSEIDVAWLIWFGYAERVLEMWSRLEGRIHEPRLQMRRIIALGHVHLVLGPFTRAESFFRQAYEQSHSAGEENLAQDCAGLIGEALRRMGKYKQSEPFLTGVVGYYRKSGNRREEARWLFALSVLHAALGEASRSLEEGKRALRLGRESGNSWLQARAHNALSLAYLQQRRSEPAEEHAKAAIELYEATDAVDGLAYLDNMIGVARLQIDDVEGAKLYFAQALRRGHEAGQPRVESIALLNVALLHWMEQRYADALVAATRAAELTARMDAAEDQASKAMLKLLQANKGNARARREALREYGLAAKGYPDLFTKIDWFTA